MSAVLWRQRIDDTGGISVEVSRARGEQLPVVRVCGDRTLELTGLEAIALLRALPAAIEDLTKEVIRVPRRFSGGINGFSRHDPDCTPLVSEIRAWTTIMEKSNASRKRVQK